LSKQFTESIMTWIIRAVLRYTNFPSNFVSMERLIYGFEFREKVLVQYHGLRAYYLNFISNPLVLGSDIPHAY
jgi:hypothetical protein